MSFTLYTGKYKFTIKNAVNYGCAGQEFFNAFVKTYGKQVDAADKAFFKWKKCVRCAVSSAEDILPYNYNQSTDSCGKISLISIENY